MFFGRKKRQAALEALIDELGDVRAKARVLRLREEALRDEIESYRPPGFVRAARFEMETKRIKERYFARKALPQYIQDDPHYWRSSWKDILVITPLDSSQMAGAVDSAYADTPLDLPPEEANYGQPLTPEPPSDAAPLPAMGHDPEVREAAEDAVPFDWRDAPKLRR